ncbi:MAG TPA: hypothetical protein VKX25_08575 [Bryobacteraceae bacterium]|jgi:hypothetical protein|nr:hypothetical protein [Bryobacteraceae bacterium]
MAKSGDEQLTYTTWEGRTITNVDVLLRDPKVQEMIRKGSKNRQQPSKKGYIAVVRYRKPE